MSGEAASPVGYVFTHSTPSFTSARTALRASSAPLMQKTNPSMPIFRNSGFQSINPPAEQISRPEATRRGPGIQSFSMAVLSQTSQLNKQPPDRAEVYPHS